MKRAPRARLAWLLVAVLLVGACASQPESRFDSEEKKAAQINAELGLKYLRNGDLQVAKNKLDKAIAQDPDNPDAHAAYALLSMELDKPDQARDHFDTALDARPDDPQLLNNYGTFLCEQGDYSEGIERFLKAARNQLYETPSYAYANAGRCARDAGRPDEARRYLRQALEADSRMGSALLELARLEYEQGRLRQSRRRIEHYHEVATLAPESLWLAIRIERRLGDRRAAERLGKRLVREYPDSAQASRFLETR